MRSELYVLVMAGLGFWTALRGNHWPGRAAIRASIIASIPLVVVGVLMWAGILSFVELSPGQSPISTDGGIVYAFYKGQQQIPGPAPLVMVLSPLLRLPGAWLWGTVGGSLGHKYANWRRRSGQRAEVRLKPDTTHHTSAGAHAAKSSCSDGGLRM